jgi:hypothetical protein
LSMIQEDWSQPERLTQQTPLSLKGTMSGCTVREPTWEKVQDLDEDGASPRPKQRGQPSGDLLQQPTEESRSNRGVKIELTRRLDDNDMRSLRQMTTTKKKSGFLTSAKLVLNWRLPEEQLSLQLSWQ